MYSTIIKHDWDLDEIINLFSLPFNELIYKSQTIHRENFNPNEVQISTLLSIKTGGCAENCKYCSQSSYNNSGLKAEKLIDVSEVVKNAQAAKDAGSTRFCMGAAWSSPKDRDIPKIIEMIQNIKDMGMESCMTLGMLSSSQAQKLADAGLDYYNHNIDTSREYYGDIVTTRSFDDRLETLENVRKSGIKTCCGGIMGMGESVRDRASMLQTLANLPSHPESVPINMLVKIAGTPLENVHKIDEFDFIRTIAVARIIMPKSYVRLSAGRQEMNDQMQSLCFMSGANSIFYGEKLLTTDNPSQNKDMELFDKLGIMAQKC